MDRAPPATHESTTATSVRASRPAPLDRSEVRQQLHKEMSTVTVTEEVKTAWSFC